MGVDQDPASSLLEKFAEAKAIVQVYRSAFPEANPFSPGFDRALAWLRDSKPAVRLEVLTESAMADPLVFVRVDDTIWAGPLFAPAEPAWLPIPMTAAQFQTFFGDTRRRLAHPEHLLPYNATRPGPGGRTLINDFSRLNETAVLEVVGYRQTRWPFAAFRPTEDDYCNVVAETARQGRKIAISGKRHSQGGQTFYEDAVVLDMNDYDRILDFDPVAKTIRVQSGATWDQIQRFVAPHGLSVMVMQAYPYFTVGGALAVSVHESDLRFGPIIDTVRRFRMLLADGRVLEVSPTSNADLYALAIGGYGLFGLILDVELQLTDDLLLEQTITTTCAADFTRRFIACKSDGETIYAYARPCFVPDQRFMDEMSLVTAKAVSAVPGDDDLFAIQPYSYLGLRKLIYDLSRSYEWGRVIKWELQEKFGDNFGDARISRNNLMRGDIRIPGDYRSMSNTDAMQEYFVPVERYASFAAGSRAILEEHRVNVMSVGIRFVPRRTDYLLSYSANADVFGAIFVVNHDSSPEGIRVVQGWTRRLVDLTLSLGGTYYLPYARYASRTQFQRAYPRFVEFIAAKDRYDPQHVFYNYLFADYLARPN